jgi:hypothetical protein
VGAVSKQPPQEIGRKKFIRPNSKSEPSGSTACAAFKAITETAPMHYVVMVRVNFSTVGDFVAVKASKNAGFNSVQQPDHNRFNINHLATINFNRFQ